MRPFQVILVVAGMYALLHVTIQSFRHVFVLLVEPRTSVLDKYVPGEQEAAEAETLAALDARYEAARTSVEKWEAGKTAEDIAARQWQEPYSTANRLKDAIETWEEHHRQIRELNFYWWGGLMCLLAGLAAYHRWHPLAGFAFFLIAFAEMIYWTSPTIGGWSSDQEFERLVLWKLLYSLATLALILGMWWRIIIPRLSTPADPVA